MAVKKKNEPEKKSAFDSITNEKHKLFISHYTGDCLFNATKAYLQVYPNVKYDSASAMGCELLRNLKIKAAINEICSQQFANIQSDIEKNETYQKIKALSSMSIEDVIDLAGRTLVVKSLDEIPASARYAIKSIRYDRKESDSSISENINVTFESKTAILKLLAEIQGLIKSENEPPKIEIVVTPAQRPE